MTWLIVERQLQVARYTLGVKRFDFDAGLAPYNLSAFAAWQRLSGHITPAVMEQLQPKPQVSGLTELALDHMSPSTLAGLYTQWWLAGMRMVKCICMLGVVEVSIPAHAARGDA